MPYAHAPVSCGWAGERLFSPVLEGASPRVLQEAIPGAQAVPMPAPGSPAVRMLGGSLVLLETSRLGGYAMSVRHLLEPRFGAAGALCRAASCGRALWQCRGEAPSQVQHPLNTFPLCPNTPRNKGLAFSLQTSAFPGDAIVFWLRFQTRGNFLVQRLVVCIHSTSLSRIQLDALGALEIL